MLFDNGTLRVLTFQGLADGNILTNDYNFSNIKGNAFVIKDIKISYFAAANKVIQELAFDNTFADSGNARYSLVYPKQKLSTFFIENFDLTSSFYISVNKKQIAFLTPDKHYNLDLNLKDLFIYTSHVVETDFQVQITAQLKEDFVSDTDFNPYVKVSIIGFSVPIELIHQLTDNPNSKLYLR